MLPAVTKNYEDRSTDAYFLFVFHCDQCGAAWASERYPYSMRDAPPVSTGEQNARALLWQAEHSAAFERANLEAMLHFNKCPQCGRRVCDDCFSPEDVLCRFCETEKQEDELRKSNRALIHYHNFIPALFCLRWKRERTSGRQQQLCLSLKKTEPSQN